MARRTRVAGVICFAAGCLIVVRAMLSASVDYMRVGIGGAVIALGLFVMWNRGGSARGR